MHRHAEANGDEALHVGVDLRAFTTPGANVTALLQGKVAVITGGSSGIGLATARRFAAEGARTVIVGRSKTRLEAAARTLSDGVRGIAADVSKLDDIERVFRTVAGELGRVDVLFVNAGVGYYAPLADMTEALYDETFAINTKGAYFTLQKALPYLNDGASVVLCAIAQPAPAWRRGGASAYVASKVALRSVAETAAVELAERGIRVNAVSPGPTRTAIYEHAGLPRPAIETRFSRMASDSPLKRVAQPEDVAGVVAFLASPDAAYLTGRSIQVDGGIG